MSQSARVSGPRILLVEDDPDLAEPLQEGLSQQGFRTVHARSGREALDALGREMVDVVVLDVMLPDVDGFSLCREIRGQSDVPVLMLTARGHELDRVTGLEVGADDYVTKPFSLRELVARLRAILRRRELDRGAAPRPTDHLVVGEITLDRLARRVWRSGRPLELRPREYRLLEVLMSEAGRALSRQELLDRVWGPDWVGDPRTLDVHVRWLREKLEPDPSRPRYIHTVRGYGYRFEDAGAE
ncbi:MAG: response regulator transcription factor [Armatimonadota bacterium]|nr:response regulator transcription factor [Armatimonadota bacterium]MDR7439328.1 response regulator transcription factor [Armatimonadota bacterium]MDR7562018.1 response regulator transcription factor [Armatimonadota bacterium]MDR7567008.1 response regulator transcription factor [Armatimonadota bacterium]